jgi:hypothetical protein
MIKQKSKLSVVRVSGTLLKSGIAAQQASTSTGAAVLSRIHMYKTLKASTARRSLRVYKKKQAPKAKRFLRVTRVTKQTKQHRQKLRTK